MVGRGFDVGSIALWSKFLAFRCRFLLKLTKYWDREQSGQLSLSHSLWLTVSSSLHLMARIPYVPHTKDTFHCELCSYCWWSHTPSILASAAEAPSAYVCCSTGGSLKGPWRAYVYVKYEYLECGRVWFQWKGLTFKCQPEGSLLPPRDRDLVSHTKLEFLSIFW